MRLIAPGAIIEPVIRIEHAVTKKFVQAAVHLVAARFIYQVHHASAGATEFCSEITALDFELLNGVHRWGKSGRVRSSGVDRNTVDQRFVRQRLASIQ